METTTLICGLPIACADADSIFNSIMAKVADKEGGWIVTLNLEMISRMAKMPEYRKTLDLADYYIADGMPLVWASKWSREQPQQIEGRTTGVELVECFLKQADIPDYAIIGGVSPSNTLAQYPGAVEACRFLFDGMVDLSEKQIETFAKKIKDNGITVVFLALGVPKQDYLAIKLRELSPNAIYIGVGGTFEILSSSKGRAPQWMQKSGLEWLYRFLLEPKRLWKRYLVNYPIGAIYLLKDLFLDSAASVAEKSGKSPIK